MTHTVKSTPNHDKEDWARTHTLTSEQRQQLIAQKLERATAQFKTRAKTPVTA
jgi:hypothetical protein